MARRWAAIVWRLIVRFPRDMAFASFAVLLLDQRKGLMGSPRVEESTKRESFSSNPGHPSVMAFRPAPGLRCRWDSLPVSLARRPSFTTCEASSIPVRTVLIARPVVRATADTPPYPRAFASAPAHSLRFRSSKIGASDFHLTPKAFSVSGISMTCTLHR